jgi:alanyl-tRNA synthetase
MNEVTDDTHVTFFDGEVAGTSVVRHVVAHGDLTAVICDQTPFHPVDHRWPDQPGDRGAILVRDQRYEVVDCVTGAINRQTGSLAAGAEITARRGDPEWYWVALHMAGLTAPPTGTVVRLVVDRPRRAALSAAHTACHLSGLALNQLAAGLWSDQRELPLDSLGYPDLDGTALSKSEIEVTGFHDTYRLGRSLRRTGFQAGAVAGVVPTLGERLTGLIGDWVATSAKAWIEAAGPRLSAPRTWHCALPAGTAVVRCGGTHPPSLAEVGPVSITAWLAADGTELHVRGDRCSR